MVEDVGNDIDFVRASLGKCEDREKTAVNTTLAAIPLPVDMVSIFLPIKNKPTRTIGLF